MKKRMSDSTSSIRIAVVAHALRAAGGLSVGQNILAALGRVAPEHHYFVSIPSGLRYEQVCREIPNCETLIFQDSGSLFRRWRFDRFELPSRVRAFQPDIVLGLGNMGLRGNSSAPLGLLCHNSYLWYDRRHYGRTYSLKNLIIQRMFKRPCFAKDLRQSKLIFCQTRTAENRIRQVYRFRGKCFILPNAVSLFTQSGGNNILAPCIFQSHTKRLRLFYLTEYYSHKNIEVLVDLFDRYRDDLSSVVVFITISSEHRPAAARLLESIRSKKLEKYIINIGPIPQERLGAYFHGVDALIMPTLLESFSGSYLEAMHLGVPILTSDLDFAHEVCGEAAIYFDPWDTQSIKDAILQIRDRPALSKSLVKKGKLRIGQVTKSWDTVAGEMFRQISSLVKR